MWTTAKTTAKTTLRRADARLVRDRSALSTFLFHSVFRDEGEIDEHVIAPPQEITVERFRRFVTHYVGAGYRFVSPDDVRRGLELGGRYVMATFDDGYFNNRLVLPVLREFDVPAVFFVVTGNVFDNTCFWWDVFYREHHRRGTPIAERRAHSTRLKRMAPTAIDEELRRDFGADVFRPRGDIDRPFTPDELADFGLDDHVHIGNHTADHGITTNFTEDENFDRILRGQDELESMCGIRPNVIAYPNGNWNDGAVRAARRAGLDLGITVEKRKNYLPFETTNDVAMMILGRFTLWGSRDIDAQCEVLRSDLSRRGLRAAKSRAARS